MFSKWLPVEAAILNYVNIKTENYKTQFISQKQAHTYIFDKYDLCLF